MSYQVRRHHTSPTSSRFRSAGFHSLPPPPLRPPVEIEEHLGASQGFDEPEPKRRKKACSASAATRLDPALWKSLPDDLFQKVVAYMPFPGVLRCRAVSRQCNEFVLSERFQEARACVTSWEALEEATQHLLVFATIKGKIMCTAYDAARNRWLRMPPMRGLDPRAKDCIAGDGGLLCFRDVSSQGSASLFVYNPVTCTCRFLPPMHIGNSMTRHTWLLTHMVYNRFTSSYKLLVLTQLNASNSNNLNPNHNNTNNRAHLEVYDSLTHAWTADRHLSLLERKYKLRFSPQVGACCDNFFYFVATEGGGGGVLRSSSVTGLVVYDIYEGVFREKLLYRCEPRCPNSKIQVQVVECKGTVYMVVREDDPKGTKGVSFCRLNPCKEQKVEDAVLFESFFTKWGNVFPDYRCVSVRDGLGLLLRDESFGVLADDLSEELKLPPCPFEGLARYVASAAGGRNEEPWAGYYETQNVVSEANFQPSAAVTV